MVEPPLPDAMFPDTLVLTPQGYAAGARGGASPSGRTPVTLPGYVETTVNQQAREEGTGPAGVVTSERIARLFLAAAVACQADDVFTWTAENFGEAPAVPKVFTAKGPAIRQGSLWLVEAAECV